MSIKPRRRIHDEAEGKALPFDEATDSIEWRDYKHRLGQPIRDAQQARRRAACAAPPGQCARLAETQSPERAEP